VGNSQPGRLYTLAGAECQHRLCHLLEGASRSGGGGPGPLEIETAEMAGDVDNFADKEETGDSLRLHGFAGEFASVYAAGGDLGFFVAFGASWDNRPIVYLVFERSEGGIGVVGGSVKLQPTLRETVWKKLLEGFAGRVEIALG